MFSSIVVVVMLTRSAEWDLIYVGKIIFSEFELGDNAS